MFRQKNKIKDIDFHSLFVFGLILQLDNYVVLHFSSIFSQYSCHSKLAHCFFYFHKEFKHCEAFGTNASSQNQFRTPQLTRFEFFKKSKEEPADTRGADRNAKKEKQKSLTRQKSVESTTIAAAATMKVQDYLKGLTCKDKTKSVSMRNVPALTSPSAATCPQKSDKGAGDKTSKVGVGTKKPSKKEQKARNKDDFLKATMRIFLVVSPPVGKIQVKVSVGDIFCSFIICLYSLLLAYTNIWVSENECTGALIAWSSLKFIIPRYSF